MSNDSLRQSIGEIAGRHGMDAFRDRVYAIRPGSIDIKVAFLGEFNAGKSTIINALLQRKLLPMFVTPTTANITIIAGGDQDGARVEVRREGGEEQVYEIPLSELATEIVNTGAGKKIHLTIKDHAFLNGHMHLVDTPGIASIEEMHDDITFGYLPHVDIALIVVNPDQGTVPKTLVTFLDKFPRELLDKIYFVINRVDQLPGDRLARIQEKIRQDLGKLYTNPRIVLVSGLTALNGIGDAEAFERSGIRELGDIIRREIPLKKEAIEERRINAILLRERDQLVKLLKKKLETVDWDTAAFDKEIEQLKQEIGKLNKDISEYRQSFNKLKTEALAGIGSIVKEYIEIIGARCVRNEPFQELLTTMINEIVAQVEESTARLKVIPLRTLDKNVADLLRAVAENEAANIKDIADLITDAATFVLTAWLVPGATPGLDPDEAIIGSGVLFAEKAGQAGGRSDNHGSGFVKGVGNFLGMLGKIVKGMNPLEKVKNTILPYIVNPRLTKVLTKRLTGRLESVYDSIGQLIEGEIGTRYLIPLRDHEALLSEARAARDEQISSKDLEKETIDTDISRLIILK